MHGAMIECESQTCPQQHAVFCACALVHMDGVMKGVLVVILARLLYCKHQPYMTWIPFGFRLSQLSLLTGGPECRHYSAATL
jgi:hypothetical protein